MFLPRNLLFFVLTFFFFFFSKMFQVKEGTYLKILREFYRLSNYISPVTNGPVNKKDRDFKVSLRIVKLSCLLDDKKSNPS